MNDEKEKFIKLFPLFSNRLDLICSLDDESIAIIIRAIGLFFHGENAEITNPHLSAIFNLLMDDLKVYDGKCQKLKERQRAYREKKAAEKAAAEPKPEKEKKPKAEKPDEFAAEVQAVIEHLNAVTGTKHSTKSGATKHIRARLKEGHTVDELKTVIDKMAKEWTGTEWQKFLRPETLFNSEKFDGYLNRPDEADIKAAADLPKLDGDNIATLKAWENYDFGDAV